MRGIFVTGTDTGVGKTVLAAAVCAALAARGERVAAFKPVVTGLDPPSGGQATRGGEWPPDHELLASITGQSPEEVAPLRFGPAVSPHLAAELGGTTIEPHELLRAAQRAGERADALVCEGVGGLMVPLTSGYAIRDLAIDLHLPVVIAARPGLGTISHSLLAVESARVGGLEVAGVVLTPWPGRPTTMELSNRDTIAQIGGVPVATLSRTTPDTLADAAATLPIDDWVTA